MKANVKKGALFCRVAALRGLFGVHFFEFISRELSDIRRQRRFINVAFYRMLCKSDQMGCGKVGALECYLKRTTRVSLKRFFTMIKTQTWCPKAMLSKYFLLVYQVPHNNSSQIGKDTIFRKTAKKTGLIKLQFANPLHKEIRPDTFRANHTTYTFWKSVKCRTRCCWFAKTIWILCCELKLDLPL